MHKTVVANSTPIIALLQIGRMDILKALYNTVRAKSSAIIKLVKPLLDDLLRCGFYISDDVRNEVLRLADELTD
jgi:predicted nucleic acid-binding protein